MIQYKYGETTIPKLSPKQSLNNAVEHFRDCIANDTMPITSKKSIMEMLFLFFQME
jgi:hypothetical protein